MTVTTDVDECNTLHKEGISYTHLII